MGDIMSLSRHVTRELSVCKRVSRHKKVGRKSLLQKTHKFNIKRRISVLKSSGKRVVSSTMKNDCNIHVCTRSIRRHLSSVGLGYANAKKKIFLTKTHKDKRVAMATNWITNNHEWSKKIFSDEKRFSLDGPTTGCHTSRKTMKIYVNGGYLKVAGS